jgi:hypothetical protein
MQKSNQRSCEVFVFVFSSHNSQFYRKIPYFVENESGRKNIGECLYDFRAKRSFWCYERKGRNGWELEGLYTPFLYVSCSSYAAAQYADLEVRRENIQCILGREFGNAEHIYLCPTHFLGGNYVVPFHTVFLLPIRFAYVSLDFHIHSAPSNLDPEFYGFAGHIHFHPSQILLP